MSRPSREETSMEMARVIALRGTCDRKRVGAVIERAGRIISIGFNGAPPGLPHCSENQHGWRLEAIRSLKNMGRRSWHVSEEHEMAQGMLDHHGCRNATHAEANALAFAAKYGVSTDNTRLFVTVSPCDTCSRLLIAAGIKEVFYLEEYRDRAGVDLLEKAGVRCEQVS